MSLSFGAVLTADWHLRETQPLCRTDNFWRTQANKIRYLRKLVEHRDAQMIMAGDLFHHWKPSPYLLRWAIRNLPKGVICVPGNHDLQGHSMVNYRKSGLAVVESALDWQVYAGRGTITLENDAPLHPIGVQGFAYGQPVELVLPRGPNRNVLILHEMVGLQVDPNVHTELAHHLLTKYKDFDLIVTGHNHRPFHVSHKGRLLVNPGSITRQRSSETHTPVVYYWDASANSVSQHTIPHDANVLSRAHITIEEERDERISQFVETLSDALASEEEMSFEDALETFLNKNKDIPPSVVEIVRDIVYNGEGRQ